MAFKRRSFLSIPLLILACALIGGIYGQQYKPASSASGDQAIESGMKEFMKVYDTVDKNFADKVNPDKAIFKGAIPGMLRTLDPHSNFFDPKDFDAFARRSAAGR